MPLPLPLPLPMEGTTKRPASLWPFQVLASSVVLVPHSQLSWWWPPSTYPMSIGAWPGVLVLIGANNFSSSSCGSTVSTVTPRTIYPTTVRIAWTLKGR